MGKRVNNEDKILPGTNFKIYLKIPILISICQKKNQKEEWLNIIQEINKNKIFKNKLTLSNIARKKYLNTLLNSKDEDDLLRKNKILREQIKKHILPIIKSIEETNYGNYSGQRSPVLEAEIEKVMARYKKLIKRDEKQI